MTEFQIRVAAVDLPVCRFTIDGREVEALEGTSVLDAALASDIYVPHICAHTDLDPIGECRLCVVTVDGATEPVTACTTPVADGMTVVTRSDQLHAVRQVSMELMLAGHPECTGCPVFGKCELQSLTQYLGVTDARWRRRANNIPQDTRNPLITHDMARCVMCGRCVRACQDLRGVNVLNYVEDATGRVRIGVRDGLTLDEAGCIYCGSCVEVCPTGAIRDAAGTVNESLRHAEAIVPCRTTCPAGIDIPRYVRLVADGDPSAALAVIREKVPLPGVLGRICDHLCEGACRRSHLGDPLSIRALKRYASEHGDDTWKSRSKQLASTGRTVAVVGSGPAGLTAAYYLAKQGHAVTVFEADPELGGMLRVGIPAYRLPREVLDAEIADIAEAGVAFRTSSPVARPDALLGEGFDAVVMAQGAHRGIRLPTPGGHLGGVHINTDFLKAAALGTPPPIGDQVIVMGGGNVAFDCAGVARELGATHVRIVCLEPRNGMRASAEEITEALEAGTEVFPSMNVDEITGDDGRVSGVVVTAIRTFSFGPEGEVSLDRIDDSTQTWPADTVIMAVGQQPALDPELPVGRDRFGRVLAQDTTGRTSIPGLFATGDVVTGTRSVIGAIEGGRLAAAAADRYLGGDGDISEQLAPRVRVLPVIGSKGPGFAGVPRATDDGLSEAESLAEANRCLQCDRRVGLTEQKFWSAFTNR